MKNYNKTYIETFVSEKYSTYPIFRVSPAPLAVQGKAEVLPDYITDVKEELDSVLSDSYQIGKKSVYNREAEVARINPLPPVPVDYQRKTHVGKGSCIIDYLDVPDDLPNDYTAKNFAVSIAKSEGFDNAYSLNEVAASIAKRPEANFHLTDGKPSAGQKNRMRYNGVDNTLLLPDMVVVVVSPKSEDPTKGGNYQYKGTDKKKAEWIKSANSGISVSGEGCASNGPDPFGTGEYLRLTSKAKKTIEAWAEITNNNVHVVMAYKRHFSNGVEKAEVIHLTPSDLFPEYRNTSKVFAHDERNRRCADIWAAALDYNFSSPLYENECKIKDPEFFTKRTGLHKKQQELQAGYSKQKIFVNEEPDYTKSIIKEIMDKLTNKYFAELSTLTYEETAKPTSSNAKYNLYNRIAPDNEVAEFWNYQAALYKIGERDNNLAPGYQICPVCGQHPVRLDKSDFDLSAYNDESMHILKVKADKGITRFYTVSDDELTELNKDNTFRFAVNCGAIKILTVPEGFQEMLKLNPVNDSYRCGFEIPREFSRFNNTYSFDENRDYEEENSEMHSSEDEDEADDIFDTISEFNDDFSSFDKVEKVNSSLIYRLKGQPNIIIIDKPNLNVPKLFTATGFFWVPKRTQRNGQIIKRKMSMAK